MAKKNNLAKVKNLECLNCGYPFFGNEIYCPECGQKNQNDALSFKNFMSEVFQGFTSWDAKFWKTIVPLLTKPGKVSKEYIEGKRAKYTNPFRFYITTSIIFFLIVGLSSNIDKYLHFDKVAQKVKKKTKKEKLSEQQIDSIKQVINKSMTSPFIPEEAKKEVLNEIEKSKNDSINTNKNDFNLTVAKGFRLDVFKRFNKKHPNFSIDQSLDSLGYEKTFFNRFLFDRSKTLNRIGEDQETFFEFLKSSTSYGAGALFVLLPVFTLFLSLFYIRRKYNYVEHLIFVFHTQTVFFLLLSLYFILSIFVTDAKLWIFIILFLLYLFLAMKNFYQQGKFKTFIKFLVLNFVYFILAIFGGITIFFLSLSLY